MCAVVASCPAVMWSVQIRVISMLRYVKAYCVLSSKPDLEWLLP